MGEALNYGSENRVRPRRPSVAAAAHEPCDRTEQCNTSVPGSGAAQRRGHAFKV